MGRMHLLELEDLPWWPKVVRDGATDWLAAAGNQTGLPYRGFVRLLAEALRRTGETRLVDLCAGAGGPTPMLLKMLREREGLEVTVTLTDLYPNGRLREVAERGGGRIEVSARSVNALEVPEDLRGLRLMCNSFHHFHPEQARRILADAVAKGQGIAVLEVVERSPGGFLVMLLAFISGVLGTPFIRPFKLSRLLLSWGLPLIPFNLLFDGIVSCLRVYGVEELQALVHAIPGADAYGWEIHRLQEGPMASTVLVGAPKVSASVATPHGASLAAS
jgi:hypothetical protein